MRSPPRKPRAGRRETAAAVRSWAGYHLKTWNHGCGHRLLLPFVTTQNIAGSGNYRTIRQNFWLTLFSPRSGHENGGVGKPRGSHTVPASQLCYYSTVPRALTRGGASSPVLRVRRGHRAQLPAAFQPQAERGPLCDSSGDTGDT